MTRQKILEIFAWSLTLLTVLLAIAVWGQSLNWHIVGASTYALFPVFGLLAFSLLWSQYIVLACRYYLHPGTDSLTSYFSITGWAVLVAILLHPGLLAWRLWRDGTGLPPRSVLSYVLPSLRWVVILGMVNFVVLLLFELKRFFANRPWWRWFTVLVDIVVLSVFYHGLRLGSQLQKGWYKYIWIFYACSYMIALVVIYKHRYSKKYPAEPAALRGRNK